MKVFAALRPLLPAASSWRALAVYVPSASAAAVTDQAPPESGATSVWSGVPEADEPLKISTLTVASSPGAAPPPPLISGVADASSAPEAGNASDTVGAAASTLKVTGPLSAVLPALSDLLGLGRVDAVRQRIGRRLPGARADRRGAAERGQSRGRRAGVDAYRHARRVAEPRRRRCRPRGPRTGRGLPGRRLRDGRHRRGRVDPERARVATAL